MYVFISVNVITYGAEFKSGGKPSPKTRETVAVRRSIQKASLTLLGLNPSRWFTVMALLTELTKRPWA